MSKHILGTIDETSTDIVAEKLPPIVVKPAPDFFTTFCNIVDCSLNTSINTFSKLPKQCKSIQMKTIRPNTLQITEEFNERYFIKTRKRLEVSQFSIMKDDIKNYRSLSDFQLNYLPTLTEDAKIEIIKIYNSMIASIEDLLVD